MRRAVDWRGGVGEQVREPVDAGTADRAHRELLVKGGLRQDVVERLTFVELLLAEHALEPAGDCHGRDVVQSRAVLMGERGDGAYVLQRASRVLRTCGRGQQAGQAPDLAWRSDRHRRKSSAQTPAEEHGKGPLSHHEPLHGGRYVGSGGHGSVLPKREPGADSV